jgi:Nucleotidyl transferase AbiEii toxin, Type IV TA system
MQGVAFWKAVAMDQSRDVLGLRLPVASMEDVLNGKIWAVQDPGRRASKRRKDLLDIERLIETHPSLRNRVHADILERLSS